MENLIAPITAGTAMVLLIDFFKRLFPKMAIRTVKIITVGLAVIFAVVLYLAQDNQNVQQGLEIFLTVLGTSQLFYGLVWKNTSIQEKVTGTNWGGDQ